MLGFAQLRAFEAVTRTGSFTKAAERLRVTIPAVSLQIRQLEREHGVTLFERLGRRVRLTPAGEMLRQYADRIFTLAHDAERALESTGDFRGTRLRLAATPTAAGYYLAPFWKRLRRRYPGLQLEVSVHNTRTVRQRLLALEDDLGMLGGAAEDGTLIVRPFARDTMMAIVSREHPWAHRKAVTPEGPRPGAADPARARLRRPRDRRARAALGRHRAAHGHGDDLHRGHQ